jgi:hypothetical protein
MSYKPSLMPAVEQMGQNKILIRLRAFRGCGRYVPIRASLTPLSAPSTPRPKKGNITPGVSKAYTSGSSETLSLVESACVNPG